MKKLVNDVLNVVPESLEGFARLHPTLAILDGHTTVVRADVAAFRASGKVAILSGGGAGHEPAHAGYVGQGMLTAAVSGDVFASPSTDAVHAALKAVGTPAGVLMIVKNYTGDRINFGLAAEMARAEGIPVETVVVDDDAALGSAEMTAGRRGIAGTVLVHKIAGAAAEAGMPLPEVAEKARQAVSRLSSMGVALTPCVVPAAGSANFEIGPDEIEFGLGIHGEAGVSRQVIASSRVIVGSLIEKIVADKGLVSGDRVVLLVNNLGSTPTMELNIVARDTLESLADRGIAIDRAYCGTFLTAIEMAGISLSVLKSDAATLAALDAGTVAPGWLANGSTIAPPARSAARIAIPPTSTKTAEEDGTGSAPPAFLDAIRAACEALIAAEDALTAMDQKVGDGDIGRSLAQGAEQILKSMEGFAKRSPKAVLMAISEIVRRSVGGTSGPLYAAFALGAANALTDDFCASEQLSAAFENGVRSVSALGGAQEGDRTMVDALVPAVRAIRAASSAPAGLLAAAVAARRGAAATAHMAPRRGRSSYLGARVLGHVDPGAEAVAIWLAAVAGQTSAE
ncbi:dihydroxyacetone kinase subunit DhaL [Chelatococcus asaccharovorans]|uniref:Homodimeric dihydroxyacetone kinase n=1 Tax=Chelatococcus asaccharovorans TaxID=28210 RepID=A0A2V3TTY8_9HYPH|nr:dihydroxyacetone kinase subunit DhaL [Chelatococcus asaccharovorans]MBS7706180.1 dihydroxyacetone kinase subunit DhaK [Chelatococcus asaccharovorans]PXW52556.1 homodimeric dihydroxyacetone kinase [Chelatococcus asaccharovorans]